MRDRAWSASESTAPTSCPSASNRSPQHGLRRDRLRHATLHRKRLEMCEPLLERKPLLIEVRARPPQLESDLPSSFLIAIDDLEDLIEPPPVMTRELLDARRDRGERPAMSGQHLLRLERRHAAQTSKVVVQRV